MEVYNKVMIELEELEKDCASPKYLIPDYSSQKNIVKSLEGVRKERASKINFISGSRNLDIILNILLFLID